MDRLQPLSFFILPSLLLGLISGCTTTPDQLNAPPSVAFKPEIRLSRLNSPETPGKQHFGFNAEDARFAAVQVTDTRAAPGQQSFSYFGDTGHAVLGGEYGIDDRLAVGLKLAGNLDSVKAFARYQLLGANRQAAQQDNVSLSVGAGYYYARGEKSKTVSQVDCFWFFCVDDSPEVLNAQYVTEGADIDLLAGYRPAQGLLLYGGYFYQDVHFRSRVVYTDRGGNPDTILARTTSRDSTRGTLQGPVMGVGIDINPRLTLMLEYLRYQLDWGDETLASGENSFDGSLRLAF